MKYFLFSNCSKRIIFDKPYFEKFFGLFVLALRAWTTVHCDISLCLLIFVFVHSPLRREPMAIYLIAAHFLANDLPKCVTLSKKPIINYSMNLPLITLKYCSRPLQNNKKDRRLIVFFLFHIFIVFFF